MLGGDPVGRAVVAEAAARRARRRPHRRRPRARRRGARRRSRPRAAPRARRRGAAPPRRRGERIPEQGLRLWRSPSARASRAVRCCVCSGSPSSLDRSTPSRSVISTSSSGPRASTTSCTSSSCTTPTSPRCCRSRSGSSLIERSIADAGIEGTHRRRVVEHGPARRLLHRCRRLRARQGHPLAARRRLRDADGDREPAPRGRRDGLPPARSRRTRTCRARSCGRSRRSAATSRPYVPLVVADYLQAAMTP